MDDFTRRTASSDRLLVVGIDGVVGANLALALSDRFAVLGLWKEWAVELDGCRTARCNPVDLVELSSFVRRHRPQWVLHCGPLASSSWDLPEEAVDAAEQSRTVSRLAALCRQTGALLTVISTDAVFAGPRMFHDEEDAAVNLHPFAQTARRVEQVLRPAESLLVRTHAYGWGPTHFDLGFAQQVWRWLIEGSSRSLDPHRHATPILATDLAELLWLAYRQGLRGTYHVAGAERTSPYRFARELAVAFGLDTRVTPCRHDPREPQILDPLQETSLSTRRARKTLQRPIPMLREGLERLAEQATGGFRGRFRASATSTTLRADAA